MFKPLIFASLFLPLAAQADIKNLQAGDETSCQMVAQETCKTSSREPVEMCLEWHQEKAVEAGADSLLIGDREESSVRRPSLTGAKTVVTTKIAAAYYDCGLKQAELQQAVKTVVNKAPQLTIEQRLIRLNTLKEKGLITQGEYDQKRQQILGEL